MNARKPPVRSCTSRIIRRCSMRSALVSPVPIMNVAVDSTPRVWAVSITASQMLPFSLSGAMAVRVQAGDRGREIEPGGPADVHDLGGTEAVQHELGVLALDRREDLLVPL